MSNHLTPAVAGAMGWAVIRRQSWKGELALAIGAVDQWRDARVVSGPMDCTFAVLAEYATTSQEGKLSVMSIFDSLATPKLPAMLPIFYVVARFEAGPAEFGMKKQIDTVLMSEDGTEKLRLHQEAVIQRPDIPGWRRTLNIIAGIGGLPFTEAGTYQFAILVDGRTEATIPLRVSETGAPNASASS